MSIDLTAIINAAIAVIGAILTYKVVPYLKDRMSDAQFQRTEAMINVAVYAAEEIYRSGHGDEKLRYVQEYLKDKGFNVDVAQIKAAVKRMRDGEGAVVETATLLEYDEDEETEQ